MGRLPRGPLFVKLTLAIFAVVALVFGVNAWFNIKAGREPLLELVEENLRFRTQAVYQAVAEHIGQCAQEVELWSKLDTLDDVLIADRSLRIENLLLGLQRDHADRYRLLTVVDRSGRVIASTDVSSIGATLHPEKLRKTDGENLRFGELPTVSERTPGTLRIAHRILSRLDSEPIGWLMADADWSPVEQLVAGGRAGSKPARFFLLIDSNRRVLAADPDSLGILPDDFLDRLLPSGVSSVALGSSGAYLVSPYPDPAEDASSPLGISAVGLWKQRVAHGVVRSFVQAVLVSALLGLLLAAGAAFVIARPISIRIGRLTEGTERLTAGSLGHRVAEGPDDEIGRLAGSFNRMAARLADASAEIAKSAARWQALVEQAPDIVMTVSSGGRIRFINRSLPGWTVEEMTGSTIDRFLQPTYRAATIRALKDVAQTGRAVATEVEVLGAGDEELWFAMRIGPIVQDDSIVALTVIATDVTERKRLEREILEVSELERKRIGRELHDGLGQVLTGTSLLVRGLEQKLSRRDIDESADARRIRSLVGQAIEQSRGMAHGLFPVVLESEGLGGALSELAEGVDRVDGVTCGYTGEVAFEDLGRGRALHLYRIAQEAVQNALRHGNPTNISIRLSGQARRGELRVEDDGCGFSIDEGLSSGMGLRMMRYRASIIGATLRFLERPEGGAVVTCRFGEDSAGSDRAETEA